MAIRTKAQLDTDIAALADFSDILPETVRTALSNIKDTVNVSIPLTFGTVTSQPHLKLRTVTETGGNAIDIPSGIEAGAAEGGFLIQSGDFFAEVPFADLLEIPVDATNDTVVDTSGSTQNAILSRGPSVGNGYESIYVGTTSGDKLLVLASSNDGTNTKDVTADINIWVLDHAHRGTFHRNDPTESAIAAQDKIGYFDNSESFEPPKLITFEDFKAALDVYSIPEWEATTSYVIGNTMRNSAGTKAYICKTAHTSGSSFPTGSTLTDNWTDLTSTGGGGTTLNAAGLLALLTAGTDIGIRTDPNDANKIEIRYTGTGGGGGGGEADSIQAWTATTSYAVGDVMRNTAGTKAYLCKTAHTSGANFPTGSTLTDNWVDMTAMASSTPSGMPANHEKVYGGHQTSDSFTSWSEGDESVSQDVRTAGTTFDMTIPGIPNDSYYYFIFPNDRLPTRIEGPFGANHVSDFQTAALNDLFGTNDFTVYYDQNESGITGPLTYTITTA